MELRTDQQADLVFLINNPKALLLHDPGVGKTPTVCCMQWYRWTYHREKTIWVMPKSLMAKNRQELLNWTGMEPDQVVIYTGKPKQVAHRPTVVIMGPDRFSLSCSEFVDYAAVDVDEQQLCFGGPKSARTAAYLRFMEKSTSGVVMTGTLLNGALDTCWSSIHMVNPQYYPMGHRSFLAHHANYGPTGKICGWRDKARLSKILGHHGIRRTFESVHGKTPIVYQVCPVEMTCDQRAAYKQLEEQALIELEDAYIDGREPGVRFARARQVMDHPESLPHPSGEGNVSLLAKDELNGKLEFLRDAVSDHLRTGNPLLVFSHLVKQQSAIHEMLNKLGIKTGWMGGHLSDTQRSALDQEFVTGKVQALVVSWKVGGVGFNWQFWGPQRQQVNDIFVAGYPYLDTDLIQGIRRIIRQDRDSPAFVRILEYTRSLDGRLRALIKQKAQLAHEVDTTRDNLQSLKS